jgi:MFS family permease
MTNTVLSSRRPGALQGWTLVSATWLSVIASAVIAPVLPAIGAQFHDQPHVSVLVSFVATLPALFVALLAGPFGLLADRIGHRRVLLAGVSLYGFCGVAPHWLNSLDAIVVTRAGVGIMEAMIMTCANAIIGDYFHGEERERWLAYETGTASIVAIGMVALGGILGEGGWRQPFLVYSLGFLLAPLVLAFTWNPAIGEHGSPESSDPTPLAKEKFRWNKLIWICLITVFASTAFYIVIVQLGFLLTERGFASSRLIGFAAAISALATPAGAILFRVLRIHISAKLALSFALSAAGFFVVAISRSYGMTVVGATINGLGSGIILPALITWALATLPPHVRGRGTGAWQSAMFFGQFISPLIMLALARLLGTLSLGVLAYAIFCSIACVIAAGFLLKQRRLPQLPHGSSYDEAQALPLRRSQS